MHLRVLSILIVASLPLAACTYDEGPDPSKRFLALGLDTPEKNKVEVCDAYGCKMKTEYRFTSNIASIRGELAKVNRNGSPAEGRRAIAYAIGLMERQVGAAIGIRDVAGMQGLASGDPPQEDCVDESINTTSYLMVLQANGCQRYAVDSWIGDNGENPSITKLEDWYLKSASRS